MGNLNQSDDTNICCTNTGDTGIFSLAPTSYALLASLIGVLLSCNLNLEQQNSFGNFLLSIGQTVLTAAAQGQMQQSEKESKCCDDDLRDEIKRLKAQMCVFEEKLNNKTSEGN
jgi:hypothetical protein